MSSSPEGPCRQILKACSQFPATSLGERAGEMRWSILEIGIWSPSAAENPELTLLLDSRVFFGGGQWGRLTCILLRPPEERRKLGLTTELTTCFDWRGTEANNKWE